MHTTTSETIYCFRQKHISLLNKIAPSKLQTKIKCSEI